MKKLIIMSVLAMGGLGINNASAQLGIRINLNLGTRPVYVPAPQPAEVIEQPVYNDYYYLPEVEAYYSVGENCYYYQDGDNWVSATYLPGMYHDFDWRTAKRYEVRTSRPYMHNDVYRARFGGFVNRDQYYARAYPERARYNNNDAYRGHEQFNNHGRDDNRGGFDRHNDHNQNGYNQPAPNRSQAGYNQPAQPAQPSQGHQGGRNNGQDQRGSNSQPANHSSGQNGGAAYNGDHYAANKVGAVQDRSDFARPIRNN